MPGVFDEGLLTCADLVTFQANSVHICPSIYFGMVVCDLRYNVVFYY